ncbi:hypothetical protein B0H37_004006 [Clostridium beijerinckii]|nr:hypothetical protein [Clostridium beijerinckii]NOV71910.1 hypothetical protein [Clostridium beijerinckii]NOW32060.1 hypothetical protein [Clostridium beijerinckii]
MAVGLSSVYILYTICKTIQLNLYTNRTKYNKTIVCTTNKTLLCIQNYTINKLGEHMEVRSLCVYICIHFVYRLTTQCPSSRIKPLYTNYNIDTSSAMGVLKALRSNKSSLRHSHHTSCMTVSRFYRSHRPTVLQ